MRSNKFFLSFILTAILLAVGTTAATPAIHAQDQARVITQQLGGAKEVSPWMEIGAAKAIAEALSINADCLSVWIQPRHRLNPFAARKEAYVISYKTTDICNHAPKKLAAIKH